MSRFSLVPPTEQHLSLMMRWFSSEKGLRQWAGPQFRYPFDNVSFKQDLRIDELASFSLASQLGELVAFGQYYLRNGHCHLGRLAVAPQQRGKGIGLILINVLLQHGCKALSVAQGSLFVLSDNTSAIKMYQKAGFELCKYPEPVPMDNCLYMAINYL